MTYKPTYPPLGSNSYRGANRGNEVTRPAGTPYPSDPAYRYLVARVDKFPTAYLTTGEIQKLRVRRRRWLEMVTVDEDGCWIWIGPKHSRSGYPIFSASTRRRPVSTAQSAFMWMLEQWIPDQVGNTKIGNRVGKDLRRTVARCRKILCVRPSCRQTGFDRQRHRADPRQRRTTRAMTEEQVHEARRRFARGDRPIHIAEDFGVPAQAVRDLKRGTTWKWLETPLSSTEPAVDPQTLTLGRPEPQNGSQRVSHSIGCMDDYQAPCSCRVRRAEEVTDG